ncbi:MAG: hypothetical protein JMDDDDMK_00129 [Acidobacteria bacterium]|nr:hypothetical protein [Acidobacteriota bacterium]
MRQKNLTMDEIKQQYPDQWVLIEFTRLDEDLNIVSGKVVETASSKDEIYRKLLGADVKKFAIEYTGEFPEHEAYIL